KNLDLLENEVLEHAREVAPYFQQQLRTLEGLPLVGEVRGMGLMACVECVADRESNDPLQLDKDVGKRIDQHCHELGLLVRPLINMCVMSPPLIITPPQIDTMVGILREGISRTMEELRKEGVWRGGAPDCDRAPALGSEPAVCIAPSRDVNSRRSGLLRGSSRRCAAPSPRAAEIG